MMVGFYAGGYFFFKHNKENKGSASYNAIECFGVVCIIAGILTTIVWLFYIATILFPTGAIKP